MTTRENMDQHEVKVTFFPPLYEQRRAWILDVLRREQVTSVVDIGCGEGTLLRCLCNPPAYILQSPSIKTSGLDNNDNAKSIDSSSSSSHSPNQPDHPIFAFDFSFDQIHELRITRLVGLDVSEPELTACASATAPRPSSSANRSSEHYGLGLPRWEQLDVQIWRGSLDVLNEDFVDTECIVSSEVIEHLEPDVYPFFAPMLLGVYHPRLLLVTTPNYSFNQRFSAPGTIDPEGCPDPTGRTSRLFRHRDHKFEWTIEEFTAYCEKEAQVYGYSVEIATIGLPLEEDPWGREEALRRATQVSLFRRLDVLSREQAIARNEALQEARRRDVKQHELIATHIHTPHPRARRPSSKAEIQSCIDSKMEEYYTDDGWSIWELWTSEEISTSCGGHLDVLLSNIESRDNLEIFRSKGTPVTDWRVTFRGEKHTELVNETAERNAIWGTVNFCRQNQPSPDPQSDETPRDNPASEWSTTKFEGDWTSVEDTVWDQTGSWGTVEMNWDEDRVGSSCNASQCILDSESALRE